MSKNKIENKETKNNDNISGDKSILKKYIVVYPFLDLSDNKYQYEVNKKYPREDMSEEDLEKALSEDRIHQLTTNDNKIGQILIKELEN